MIWVNWVVYGAYLQQKAACEADRNERHTIVGAWVCTD